MRKKTFVFAMAAAAALMTAGCQSKYEKVEVPGNAAEAPETAGKNQAADGVNPQSDGKNQQKGGADSAGLAADGEAGNKNQQADR